MLKTVYFLETTNLRELCDNESVALIIFPLTDLPE